MESEKFNIDGTTIKNKLKNKIKEKFSDVEVRFVEDNSKLSRLNYNVYYDFDNLENRIISKVIREHPNLTNYEIDLKEHYLNNITDDISKQIRTIGENEDNEKNENNDDRLCDGWITKLKKDPDSNDINEFKLIMGKCAKLNILSKSSNNLIIEVWVDDNSYIKYNKDDNRVYISIIFAINFTYNNPSEIYINK